MTYGVRVTRYDVRCTKYDVRLVMYAIRYMIWNMTNEMHELHEIHDIHQSCLTWYTKIFSCARLEEMHYRMTLSFPVMEFFVNVQILDGTLTKHIKLRFKIFTTYQCFPEVDVPDWTTVTTDLHYLHDLIWSTWSTRYTLYTCIHNIHDIRLSAFRHVAVLRVIPICGFYMFLPSASHFYFATSRQTFLEILIPSVFYIWDIDRIFVFTSNVSL